MTPLVSVIIPTYKRPDNLERAINSVLLQSYSSVEIIVVDDNNSESSFRKMTEKLMETYATYENIKYIKHSENLNGATARNTGIKHSEGEYIAFLDDDDEFLPSKILLQMEKLQALGEEYCACYTKFVRKINGKTIGVSSDNTEGSMTYDILASRVYVSAGSNLLIKKNLVEEINGFDIDFQRKQDIEFFVRISEKTKIGYVDNICLIRHMDDRQNSSQLSLEIHENILKQFLEKFRYIIKKFPVSKQNKIYQSQYLFLIRRCLLKFDFGNVKRLMRQYDINYFLVLRFILYSVKGKLSKKIYGFKI